jgi:hypothetical protein
MRARAERPICRFPKTYEQSKKNPKTGFAGPRAGRARLMRTPSGGHATSMDAAKRPFNVRGLQIGAPRAARLRSRITNGRHMESVYQTGADVRSGSDAAKAAPSTSGCDSGRPVWDSRCGRGTLPPRRGERAEMLDHHGLRALESLLQLGELRGDARFVRDRGGDRRRTS